jgi:hypothetical protein
MKRGLMIKTMEILIEYIGLILFVAIPLTIFYLIIKRFLNEYSFKRTEIFTGN